MKKLNSNKCKRIPSNFYAGFTFKLIRPDWVKEEANIGKERLVYGTGAAALIFVLSAIGWFLFSKHTITVEYDAKKGSISTDNVSISPSGEVEVTDGNSLGFTIMPEPDYHIVDLVVDGKSVGASSSYTMEDVKDDHTISVRFMKNIALVEHNNGFYGTLYGNVQVRMPDGDEPASGARVTVASGGETWTASADQEGNYEIQKIILRQECSPPRHFGGLPGRPGR